MVMGTWCETGVGHACGVRRAWDGCGTGMGIRTSWAAKRGSWLTGEGWRTIWSKLANRTMGLDWDKVAANSSVNTTEQMTKSFVWVGLKDGSGTLLGSTWRLASKARCAAERVHARASERAGVQRATRVASRLL
jgi:hypothetical protein